MSQSLRSIRLFVAAFEELSFTEAARRENATQSGVSQHVSDLEESLGVRLFLRSVGAVRPTPAGTAYYSACIELLNAHERTLRAVKPYQGSRVGEITVGMTPVMSRAVLAPAYARFARENPNVGVRVIDSYFGDLTDRVRQGEMNFAIVPSAVGSKGVRTSLFARVPELLVSGKAAPTTHGQPVRLRDLAPLALALPGANNARRRMIDAYLAANGVAVKRLLEFDTMLGTLDLVARGDWSVILPLMMMAPDLDSGRYTINPIVDPPLWLDLFLLEPARRMSDESALAFLDCLREELEGIVAAGQRLTAPGRRRAGRANISKPDRKDQIK
ncbi:MAG: LysR family transcriptional regulator [Burkholderiales bacterium]|nr:LysR family transcriptional regulator [Burkholderiales bacterium]